jgi:hypothetical protein
VEGSLINKEHTVYVSPSCFIRHRYKVYVKDILLSTDPPLVRYILIFSYPHTTHPSCLSGPMDTQKVKVQVPNSMNKGKNLEMLITATSQPLLCTRSVMVCTS